jgi:class 3 adenylate cyclase/predicted ATPase
MNRHRSASRSGTAAARPPAARREKNIIADVGVWLQNLGLAQYERAFRDNAIDETVLASLTAEDLKDLGVTAVGHRRKLLNAIAALHSPASVKAPTPPPAVAVSDRPAGAATERRQVTVMFADLVGFTALSARMDPEDLRELIAAYYKCVGEIVRRLDGFVAQYLGDGVLVYFGYPLAHEDDAERAVWAGLELSEAIGQLKTKARLRTRVGIATGLVVVGDLLGSSDPQGRGIVGETPNLAARLQAIARPNTVVISESTRKLLGDLFDLEDIDTRQLKGIDGPVRVWMALRASSVASRFEALHGAGLTALCGRQEELELMKRLWACAKGGAGQVALLSGEPGIGKSRLAAALMEHVAAEPHTRLRYFCSPHHTDSALYPIISRMERAAGFAHDDTPQARLDKLDALLAQTATSNDDAALFADMLSLRNDGRYPALTLTPQQRRQMTLDALGFQVKALARRNPVLMIFEDAHWADPTSMEALGQAVERVANHRILLIVTFRPDFSPPWAGQPRVTALTLNPLSEPYIEMMIDSVAADKHLPLSLRQDIIERTDGIPLFVEEMTKAVLEAGSHGAGEEAIGTIPSPALQVPASLHASLMARIDRLGSAKEVAQIGAAIGREFSQVLLAAVARKPEAQLNAALDRLLAAGLLFRQGVSPDAIFLFKHALVQDAAYGMLLREQRRALHTRIAETLENQFADLGERRPELLARHFTEAGLLEKAAPLWGRAGQRSLERSALLEAIEQLTRALDQIAALPATPALRREQIKLQVALLTPLIHVKGYAAPETKAAAERARLLIAQAEELGERPDDPLLLFSVLYGIWVASFVAFKGDVMRELAAQFLALAEKQGTTIPVMVGHRNMGVSLLHIGDIEEARLHIDRAIALYDAREHRQLATRFGQDVRVALLFYRSLALWVLGYPEAALADGVRAVAEAREIGQAPTLMPALTLTALTHIHCGSFPAANAQLDEVIPLADAKAASFWKAGGVLVKGCLLAATGRAADAVRMITSGLSAWSATGTTVWTPTYFSYLATAYAELRQWDDALRSIGEAMKAAQTSKEGWYEAEIYRVAGEIALRSPMPDLRKAEAHFGCALEIARKQRAKSWELRAAMSMARLHQDQGRPADARNLLEPVYGRFTEGLDTADLKDAKALLDAMPAQA